MNPRPKVRRLSPVVGALMAAALCSSIASGQPQSDSLQTLRERVQERFDVLVTGDATSFRAKDAGSGVRWVELTDGAISVNGATVTGAELRERLGDDADLIIRLSYLDAATRHELFATPAPLPAPAPTFPTSPSQTRQTGDRVRIGGSITIDEGQEIEGNVVAIGGSAHVNGEVHGDVVAIGGSLDLGPGALVTGDAVVVGGRLHRDSTAEVRGHINEVGFGMIDFGDWRPRGIRFALPWLDRGVDTVFRLLSTLSRAAVLCLLVGLVVLIARDHVERAGERAAREPVKSGIVGVLSQLLFVPLLVITIIVLVITIVGIPFLLLLPFAILGLAIVGLLGFASVAHYLGQLVNGRFRWTDRGPLATALIGVLVILAPVLLARFLAFAGGFVFPMTIGLSLLGTTVEYLAWTVGFGAVALTRFNPSFEPPTPTRPPTPA